MAESKADQGFPYIHYDPRKGPRDWGRSHGESFRQGIRELVAIRRELMRAMNPKLAGEPVTRLAKLQWERTKAFSPDLIAELEGIAEGSGASHEDLIVLNNYTDFRDIDPEDQGCSTLYLDNGATILAGQTWDMHGSAKNYVSVLHVPAHAGKPEMVLFSLVGCLGMMGYTPDRRMIGVNNLNTKKAQAGILWPALVREALSKPDRAGMEKTLREAEVTSGHNYLVGTLEAGTHWEISPTVKAAASTHAAGTEGFVFHTNHCLTREGKAAELPASLNSTTHVRYGLLEKKLQSEMDFSDLHALLTDHEGYPKSICSHFQSGAQDPSFTCGGAIGDLKSGRLLFWRGCPAADTNYVEREFSLKSGTFSPGPEHKGIRPERKKEIP